MRYAVDAMGGGRNSAIIRKISATRSREMVTGVVGVHSQNLGEHIRVGA